MNLLPFWILSHKEQNEYSFWKAETRFRLFLRQILRVFCGKRFRIVFSTDVGLDIVDIRFHKQSRQKPAVARASAHMSPVRS